MNSNLTVAVEIAVRSMSVRPDVRPNVLDGARSYTLRVMEENASGCFGRLIQEAVDHVQEYIRRSAILDEIVAHDQKWGLI